MHTIRQILANKGSEIHTTSPETTVYDGIRQLGECGVGALLVMDGDRPAGMFSERDYARKIILAGRGSRQTRVGEIMTSPLISIEPSVSAAAGLAMMTEKRIRHLPVIEDDQLIGLVSIGDLVAAVIDDQQHLIEQLERYVVG